MSNKLNTNDKSFIADCKKVKKGTMSLKELIDTLKFRFYIPLSTKVAVADLVDIVLTSGNSESIDMLDEILKDLGGMVNPKSKIDIIKEYELTKFMFVVSQYIGTQIGNENCTEEVYDLLHEIGLVDYILDNANRDWDKFNEIVDNVTGIKYYALTESIMNLFNDIPTQDKLKEFTNTVENIDPEKINNLRQVLDFNDPMTSQVVEAMKITAIEDAMGKGKENLKVVK